MRQTLELLFVADCCWPTCVETKLILPQSSAGWGSISANMIRDVSLCGHLHVCCCNWEAENPSNPSTETSSGCFYITSSLMCVAGKVSSKVTKTGGNNTCERWALLYKSHNILQDDSYWDYRDLSGTWTHHGWVLPSGHAGFYTTFSPLNCRREQNKSLTHPHTPNCSLTAGPAVHYGIVLASVYVQRLFFGPWCVQCTGRSLSWLSVKWISGH